MFGNKRPLVLPSTFLALVASSTVQGEAGHEEAVIEEIIVSVPFEQKAAETALPVGILSGEALREKVAGSIGETLREEIGVSSESFGPGVGRPIIRGQTGNRVKVLQNGAGVTDAASLSPDHANGVEAVLAERLEVIRGPSTLLFGSGAIGGVVNVIDGRIPDRAVDRPVVSLEQSYDSVNSQNKTVGQVTFGGGPIVVNLGAFRRDSGDVDIDGSAIDVRSLEILEERLHGDEDEAHEDEALPNTRGFIGNSDIEVSGGSVGASVVGDWGFFGVSVSELDNNYGLPPGTHAHHEEEGEEEEDHHGHGDEDGDHGAEEVEFVRLDMRKTRHDVEGAWLVNGKVLKDIRYSFGRTNYEHAEVEFSEDDGAEVGTLFSNEGVEGRATMTLAPGGSWEAVLGTQVGDTEFSATGEEAHLLLGAGLCRVGTRRNHALRQVVEALEAAPRRDHELARVVQTLQGHLGRLPPPPGPAVAGLVLEIRRSQGTLGPDALQHRLYEGLVLRPPLATAAPARRALHAGQVVAKIGKGQIGGGVGPVLEDAAIAGQQLIQHGRVIPRRARPQHVLVGPLYHADRVDLHISEVLDGAGGCGLAPPWLPGAVQSLGPQGQAPGRGEGEFLHSGLAVGIGEEHIP